MNEITVGVVKRADRKYLVLRWIDRDGNSRERTTKATRRREAFRAAADLKQELQAELHGTITWFAFRRRCEVELYGGARAKTLEAFNGMANHVERLADPYLLSDLTSSEISKWAAELRRLPTIKSETSVKSYLCRLRTVMRWAHEIELLDSVPSFAGVLGKTSIRHMRGRPITTEEFERMLERVPSIVGMECAQWWRFYLTGLWLSGLRLGESLKLLWEEQDDQMHIYRLDAARPMLRIWEESEKGKRDRLLALTPDFVEHLRTVDECNRGGEVFRLPLFRYGKRIRTTNEKTVSKKVSAIGEAANVIVGQHKGGPRYATAHDLRRSFGERWALKVRPVILKELMRHSSLETTMKYYVGENALRTADEVWESHEKEKIGHGTSNRSERTT